MKSLNTAFSFAPPSILSLTIEKTIKTECKRMERLRTLNNNI